MASVWDRGPLKKLLVLVHEARAMKPKGKADARCPYIKLNCGSKNHRTRSPKKKTLEPKWQETFVFDLGNEDILRLQLMDSSGLRDESLGKLCIPGLQQLPSETVVERWYECFKGGEDEGSFSAEIRVSLLFSDQQENRRRAGTIEELTRFSFHYSAYEHLFKTGDLILYNGIGTIPTMSKLYCGTPYSHVGLIVKLPNKWTQRDEMFVFELSRNREDFLDAYVERPTHAIPAIYRLLERFHSFHGSEIWWSALDKPLSAAEAQHLCQCVVDTHHEVFTKTRKNDDSPPELPWPAIGFTPSQIDYLEFLGISPKVKAAYSELLSAEVVARMFRSVGREISEPALPTLGGAGKPNTTTTMTAAALQKSELFCKPVMIRCRHELNDIARQEIEEVHATNPPPKGTTHKEPTAEIILGELRSSNSQMELMGERLRSAEERAVQAEAKLMTSKLQAPSPVSVQVSLSQPELILDVEPQKNPVLTSICP